MRLDAAVEESQQAPKDAEMMQSGQQLLADQGPVTRAKYAKRHSEPLYSPRLSPTQIKHASAGSRVTVAQQACAQLLRHEPAVPSVSSPQPAAAAAAGNAGAGGPDTAWEQQVDWNVVEAWLSTPEGGAALEWEGLEAPALDALLQVSPPGSKHVPGHVGVIAIRSLLIILQTALS